jgi:hypothetical protein
LGVDNKYYVDAREMSVGVADPSKDGRGRTWMVLSVSEITDYMNGTDAESDEFTGVSRNYVEFMITKKGK